ncbi:MAG: nucleotidyltransferase family protein [Bacteroidota bacterium]|nr:nucleotidyltransferase family protein [Bacteroidota bacterium]
MHASTAIIILAAGESSRMGEPKQLLEYNGSTLIHRTIEIALKAKRLSDNSSNIFIVLGSKADDIKYEIVSTFNRKERKGFNILINPEWHEGIASSIRCGISALPHSTDAVLFLLCDQPLVTAEHADTLINASMDPDALIVASAYGGTLGVPALFKKALFPELMKLTGNEGARRVIHDHQKETIGILFPGAEFDMDKPGESPASDESSHYF